MLNELVILNNGKPVARATKILPAWNKMREEYTKRRRGDHIVTCRINGATFKYSTGGFDNFHEFVLQERRMASYGVQNRRQG